MMVEAQGFMKATAYCLTPQKHVLLNPTEVKILGFFQGTDQRQKIRKDRKGLQLCRALLTPPPAPTCLRLQVM